MRAEVEEIPEVVEAKGEAVAAAMVKQHHNQRDHRHPKVMGAVVAEESGAVAVAAAARKADRSRQRRSGRGGPLHAVTRGSGWQSLRLGLPRTPQPLQFSRVRYRPSLPPCARRTCRSFRFRGWRGLLGLSR